MIIQAVRPFIFSPYSTDQNLGEAYNDLFKQQTSDDAILLLSDQDVMFFGTEKPGHILAEIIGNKPNFGIITCLTNRINNSHQRTQKTHLHNVSDTLVHENEARITAREQGSKVERITAPISGHVMVVRKRVWREVGGFLEKGILRVDNDFSCKVENAGYSIFLALGIYVYHHYRMGKGGYQFTDHLK
jgi:GT2 family glycosyltransferase